MRSKEKWNTVKENLLNYGSFSTYRNAIYGLAALWIVSFHGTMLSKIHFEPKFLFDTLDMGNIGVDIFFFLSGVGLYFSFSKGPALREFYWKRFVRVYIPYLMMALPYLIYALAVHDIDVWLFIQAVLTVNNATGETTTIDFWYIFVILIFYLLYPLIYRFLFRKHPRSSKLSQEKRELLRVVILAAASIAAAVIFFYCFSGLYDIMDRIPSRFTVFIIGCYAGKPVKEKKRFSIWFLIAAVLIIACSYPLYEGMSLHGIWFRYYGSLTGIALVYVWSQLFALFSCVRLDRLFAFFGAFSLEIYVMSIIVRKIYLRSVWYGEYALGYYVLAMLIALVAAFLVSLIEKPVIQRLLCLKKMSASCVDK